MFKNLSEIVTSGLPSSYSIGLLQTKAFRILKKRTSLALSSHKLSAVNWAFLGVLFDHPKGLRSLDVARLLEVEQPFITKLIAVHKKNGMVNICEDSTDRRAKIVCLSPGARKLIPKLEKEVRNAMRPLVKGMSIKDLVCYIKVLRCIVENDKELK